MIVPPAAVYGVGALVVLLCLLVLVMLLRTGPQGAGGASVNFTAIREGLQGYKTYIGIVLTALNNYAARRGWIDQALADNLNYGLIPLTAVAVVAKLNRTEQKAETATTAAKIAAVRRPTDDPVKEGI